jgi:predicted AAA+ superfamily ATPase
LIPVEDLLHREKQLGQIERNTRLFLSGRPANHALLWGARGTGKSSIIRATLTRHGGKELGMIELDREGLAALGDLIQILGNQDRKYILFIDDLSFEANDPSYKGLKALLDGSLMAPPDNVLVYASSNRRHLLPESMQDNLAAQVVEGELHEGDAIDEKVSLSERFGLWLAFHPFNQDQYLDIVRAQIETVEGDTPEQTREIRDETRWQKEALMFARLRGSRSGRVAHQFVRYWLAENLADI